LLRIQASKACAQASARRPAGMGEDGLAQRQRHAGVVGDLPGLQV
jgi:hypothetical protein